MVADLYSMYFSSNTQFVAMGQGYSTMEGFLGFFLPRIFAGVNFYKKNLRRIGEVNCLLGEFGRKIVDSMGGFDPKLNFAYVGYENNPRKLKRESKLKLPNVTHFWNWPTKNSKFVYSSSMGHVHDINGDFTQEVYEFHGYGGMLVSDKDGVSGKKNKFYVCKPQDKVAVPAKGIMTLFNLSNRDLLVWDMANPDRNSSKKDLIGERGPMMMITQKDCVDSCHRSYHRPNYFLTRSFGRDVYLLPSKEVIFHFNRDYNDYDIDSGNKGDIVFKVDLHPKDLGDLILKNSSEFRERGIEVIEASPKVECSSEGGGKYTLESPFLGAVNGSGSVYDLFNL